MPLLPAGPTAVRRAIERSFDLDLGEVKRQYLDASMADGRGGSHTTGVRWWLVFMVYVVHSDPLPDGRLMSDYRSAMLYEDYLEDYAVWLSVARPSGRQISHKSIGKYVSSVRAWYRREQRARLGLGHEGGRITDILKGYARQVPQPPKLERLGVAPAQLAQAWRRRGTEQMWRSATSMGLVGLLRGCEFALTGGEAFQESEHITPADVTFFVQGGRRHARVRMRKRKDLRMLNGKHDVVFITGEEPGAHFDPVLELERWLEIRQGWGLPDDGALFCLRDGTAITVDMVRDEVKALMESIGLDPAHYGAHSLRIGGASAALAAGVPPSLIRLMGRWSSDVYEVYCRLSSQAALRVGGSIAAAEVETVEGGFNEEHLELLPVEMERMRDFDGFFAPDEADGVD